MLDWIVNNLDAVLGAWAALHVLAVFIVNLTPTPTDNVWVEKAYRWVERLAGIWTEKAKRLPGEGDLRLLG